MALCLPRKRSATSLATRPSTLSVASITNHSCVTSAGLALKVFMRVFRVARGRGYGGRLFDHAVLHARNRGIDTLVVHMLSENTAMLRIARQAGARVDRDGGDSMARLRLPPEDFRSHIDEMVEDGAAEIDYQLKVQARRVTGVIDAIDEIRQQIQNTRPRTPE
jgi:hypothetical protein